jgi:hypothetical protein
MPEFDYIAELDKVFKEKIYSADNDDDRAKEIVLLCIGVIIKQPETILGFLRFQSLKQKMLQLLTQSFEIKTGDMLEMFFTNLISSKYTNINKNIIDPNDDSNKKKCDQLFYQGDDIIFIEHKIRDNHDSTKKVGQSGNFDEKIKIIHKLYPENKIRSYEWFIDDQFKKNRNYYESIIDVINNETSDYNQSFLMYGRELIDEFFDSTTWDKFVEAYLKVKTSYVLNIDKAISSYDFDEDPSEIIYKELIKKRKPMIRLFFNKEFKEVRNEFFSGGKMAKKIYEYHKSKKTKTKTGQEFISEYEKERNRC